MADIIFIGAGPIGLLGAIQLKLQCHEIQILMFEKYENPTRNHSMYVDHNSFAEMDRSEGFGTLLDKIPSKVIISDLEKTLRKFATEIGIQIKYKTIESFDELQKQYPDTNYFVGSGGIRGIVHSQVFKDENQIKETIRYAVEVKYKVSNETRSLNKVTELPAVLKRTNHMVSEYVGHQKDNITPISLRIFVNESTASAMKGATFKTPYSLKDKDKIPTNLYETIATYMSARKHIAKETVKEGSLTISPITLSIYASKDFCKEMDGKTIFQIGEEALAFPFYRSFNDNALCIPAFATTMIALFENRFVEEKKSKTNSFFLFSMTTVSPKDKDPLEYYQQNVQNLVDSEIRAIHLLDTGLEIIEKSVTSSQALPEFPISKLHFKSGGQDFLDEIHGNNKKQKEEQSTANNTTTPESTISSKQPVSSSSWLQTKKGSNNFLAELSDKNREEKTNKKAEDPTSSKGCILF